MEALYLDFDDKNDVFARTTEWAIDNGITTVTNHILTPYPGTPIFEEMKKSNRIITEDWRKYDTRHLTFNHPNITKEEMEKGYKEAYKEFYKWSNIFKDSKNHEELKMKLKHFTYAGAWKKFEPVWNFLIKTDMLPKARRVLVNTLK